MADPATNGNNQPQQQNAPNDDDNDQPLQDVILLDDNDDDQLLQDAIPLDNVVLNIPNGGADYTRYSIVEEQEICLRKMLEDIPRPGLPWDQRARTQEFSVGSVWFKIRAKEAYRPNVLRMTNAYMRPNQVEAAGFSTVAEVVLWKWNKHGGQKIMQKCIVSAESSSHYELTSRYANVYCIIRQLRKRRSDESPCPPLDDADEFTITVGSRNFVVSALRLQSASSVFRTMLNVCDRAERKVTTKDDDPEEFRTFLAAITPGNDVRPNHQNVRGLLKLAEKYQVDFVKKQCAQHLMLCVEIPLLERLVIADKCGLDSLKNDFLCMLPYRLRAFYRANCAELRSRISHRCWMSFSTIPRATTPMMMNDDWNTD